MIIKLNKQAVVDGKLREKGEVFRTNNFDGDYVVIKSDKSLKDEKDKKIKKVKDG